MNEQIFRIGWKRHLVDIVARLFMIAMLSFTVGVFVLNGQALGIGMAGFVLILVLALLWFTYRQVDQILHERIVLEEEGVRKMLGKHVTFEARYTEISSLRSTQFGFRGVGDTWTAHSSDRKVLLFKRDYEDCERLATELESRTGLTFKADSSGWPVSNRA